ncbi:MAG: hypothetical protein HY924_00580 [Elusimicrobia bacterium]|nr:hypothetical protein [Elusimicrobiota bacterium]
MIYRKSDFGKALLKELGKGYAVARIAHWAFVEHLDHIKELEDGLDSEMMTVIAMGEGAQFHLSEDELRQLAARLLGS